MDLIEKILEMASKGVYRSELILLGRANNFSDKAARAAIQEAKQRGMYIVSELSRPGDTYYQYK